MTPQLLILPPLARIWDSEPVPASAVTAANNWAEFDAERKAEEEYRGWHHAPGPTSDPSEDVTADHLEDHYPDYYEHPEYYEHDYGPGANLETRQQLRKVKGNPDAELTVYRAAPAGHGINKGDWVTTSRKYAQRHEQSQNPDLSKPWTIYSRKAKANELYSEGNEINEWGYSPKDEPITAATESTTQVDQIDGSDEDDHDAQEIALGGALAALFVGYLLPGPGAFLPGSVSWDDQVEARIGPTLQGFLQRSAMDIAVESGQPGATAIALQQAEETYPGVLAWIQGNSMQTLQNLTDSNVDEHSVAQAATGAAENLARGAAIFAKSEVRNETVGKLGAVYKVWRTRHDDRVRPMHVELDGDEVPYHSPFFVDGLAIRYPGDPLAPISLTANCRCHLVYHISPKEKDYGPALLSGAVHAFEEALHPRGSDGKFIQKGDHVVISEGGKKAEGVVEGFQPNGARVKLDQGGQVLTVPHNYISQAPTAEAHLGKIPHLTSEQVKDLRGGSAEKHLVTDASGTHFTPERQALHDKIIKDIVAGHKAQANPAFVMLGGGPASGKTKAAEAAEKEFPDAIKIDPDEIKKSIPEYKKMSPEEAAAHVHEESSYLAKRVQAEALKTKSHVVLDAVGDSSATNVKGKIDQAHAAGYTAHARYVTVPTDVAQERAHARGIKSGRVVPPEVIKQLHKGVSKVLPAVVHHFDTASLHDNSGTEFKTVLTKSHGGEIKIHDAPAYHDFIKKGAD